ncbi:deoxyribonuclease 1, partial [Homo sapiens]
HYVVSEPLGRNSYKERYLFVYRPDQVSAVDSYYYDDGCEPCGNDTFNREPAIVRFFSRFTGSVPHTTWLSPQRSGSLPLFPCMRPRGTQ